MHNRAGSKNVAATSSFVDIDDNGSVDALSDGLLLLRYLFGLRGDTLTSSVVVNDAGESHQLILRHISNHLLLRNPQGQAYLKMS